MVGQGVRTLLIESRAVRRPTVMRRVTAGVSVALVIGGVILSGVAWAQEPPQITPDFSITPSKTVTPWIYQMAVGAIILGGIIVLGVTASYLRFSPKFFGREEAPKRLPPGARPPLRRPGPQARQPAAVATASAARATTAVAEPSTPSPTEPAPVAEAPPVAPTEPAPAAEAPAPTEPAPTEPAPAAEAPPSPPPSEPAAAPAPASRGESALDQETFDRVLEEQLAKGMDRRVAEGRARAAAVVAARRKAQG